jgi:hypothetical protein
MGAKYLLPLLRMRCTALCRLDLSPNDVPDGSSTAVKNPGISGQFLVCLIVQTGSLDIRMDAGFRFSMADLELANRKYSARAASKKRTALVPFHRAVS